MRCLLPYVVVAVVLASSALPGNACFRYKNTPLHKLLQPASVILVGKIVAVKPSPLWNAALVHIETLVTLRGKHRSQWRVIWQNATFGYPLLQPSDESTGPNIVIGLRSPSEGQDIPFVFGNARPSAGSPYWRDYWIVQRPCSRPGLVSIESLRALDDHAILERHWQLNRKFKTVLELK